MKNQEQADYHLSVMNATLSNMQNAENMGTFLDSYDRFAGSYAAFCDSVRNNDPKLYYTSKSLTTKLLLREARDMKDAAREMLVKAFHDWPQPVEEGEETTDESGV